MRKGFTLLELLIATAIFTGVIIAVIGIFVSVLGVQGRQTSSAAVEQESQALLQKVQYYVELSSYVSSTVDVPTSTLVLRMPTQAIDPTVISLSGGTVYLTQATGTPVALTSNRVTVPNLSFTRHANPPGHDSVSIAFTISYNTSNIKQAFSQALQTSIARVSAANFDSGIFPSSTGLSLGSLAQLWSPIDGALYILSNGNVGVGVASPQQPLEVNGGIRLNTAVGNQPSCNSNARGTLFYLERATAATDTLQLCTENPYGYQWVTLY
jgi:Tfp pilus assembly protein PilE